MKCGVEFVDGALHMIVLFTRVFSDWSTSLVDRQGYFPPDQAVIVGPMCAAPEGNGLRVRFDDWTMTAAAKS
jgi:regulation of enolase protein 1 (concanavalin A-like superfamily)